MRHTHGCEPRNPLNMIIQENHAADGANLIISYRSWIFGVILLNDKIAPKTHLVEHPTSPLTMECLLPH